MLERKEGRTGRGKGREREERKRQERKGKGRKEKRKEAKRKALFGCIYSLCIYTYIEKPENKHINRGNP